jgi:DNA-binding transcriptional LysR family regulator
MHCAPAGLHRRSSRNVRREHDWTGGAQFASLVPLAGAMASPPDKLQWDDFRLIKAIADAKGLPAAAASLSLNHSTLFRRLGQIEQDLGVKLFERHRNGYALTPAGEEMVAVANRLNDDVTGFARRLAGKEITPAGELRVTTNDSLLIHLLTPSFARFREQCRDIRLDLVVSNRALNLSQRDADVAIRATDNPPDNLVGRRAARIAWALYGHANDFPNGPPENRDQLYARPWVSLGDSLGQLQVVKFAHAHVAPENLVYRIDSVLGLAEAIESRLGIGHVPCFIADRQPSLVRLSEPMPEFSGDLWLLTHPDLRSSARVRIFLDFLAAEIAKERDLIEGRARKSA